MQVHIYSNYKWSCMSVSLAKKRKFSTRTGTPQQSTLGIPESLHCKKEGSVELFQERNCHQQQCSTATLAAVEQSLFNLQLQGKVLKIIRV